MKRFLKTTGALLLGTAFAFPIAACGDGSGSGSSDGEVSAEIQAEYLSKAIEQLSSAKSMQLNTTVTFELAQAARRKPKRAQA